MADDLGPLRKYAACMEELKEQLPAEPVHLNLPLGIFAGFLFRLRDGVPLT